MLITNLIRYTTGLETGWLYLLRTKHLLHPCHIYIRCDEIGHIKSQLTGSHQSFADETFKSSGINLFLKATA